jgi:hypothetical protein
LKPGTKEWKDAVEKLRSLGKNSTRDYRVSTVEDALQLLKEGRGHMDGYGKYGMYKPQSAPRRYEFHLNEDYPGSGSPNNNLPHIKWIDAKEAYGHIFYNIQRFMGQ